MPKTKRRTHRATHRAKRFNKQLDDTGKWLLEIAEDIYYRVSSLDTAVRDDVCEGLARIVHAGNDCVAANLNLNTEQWMSFIDGATADWFRRRGFAEWFCVAAANGFRKSRPRDLAERIVRRTACTETSCT